MTPINPVPAHAGQTTPTISVNPNSTASSSPRTDFATTHRPGSNVASPATPSNAISIKDCRGTPTFSEGLSPQFKRACEAAEQAFFSAENVEYFDMTGRLSPAAADAIHRLSALVTLKSSDDRASAIMRHTFQESKLTPEEATVWLRFASRLPDSFWTEPVRAANWHPASKAELRETLARDDAFKPFLDKPEGQRFVSELADALAKKSANMNPTDTGFVFTMQFAHAYGTVNHIAGGSFWRDVDGKLQMGIIHQESFPGTIKFDNPASAVKPKTVDSPADKKSTTATPTGIAVGKVYDHLDTTADHPDKRGTMIESIKLAGMPAVNLFPCPAPQAIPKIAKSLNATGFHPYGPTATWNNGDRGKLPQDRAFQCCFDVTGRAMHVAFQMLAPRLHLLPNNLDNMRFLASIAPGEFDTVDIPNGKGTQRVQVRDINKLDVKGQNLVFKTIGSDWGRNNAWDVPPQTSSQIGPVTIKPGEGMKKLAQDQYFKFIGSTKGLTLDGATVRPEKVYTAAEGERMKIAANAEPLKTMIIITTPVQNTQRVNPSATQAKL
jgi:hypothetical protein